MIDVKTATEIINQNWLDFGETFTSCDELTSVILAESVSADRDYPPAPLARMDGIAVSWQQYQQGKRAFIISGIVGAGQPPQNYPLDTAIEVMTGAVLPSGFDLIIPYEDLEIEQKTAVIVNEEGRFCGQFVHQKGSDCLAGTNILQPAMKLHGARWGIIASMGKNVVKSMAIPRINLISTGNELVEITETPQSYQLRKSNIYALKASLLQRGFNHITLTHLQDDPDEIRQHYDQATANYDILIYSGGVSKGKFDYLPSIWAEKGAVKHFHRVAQKPGKPLWFGVDYQHKTMIFGLPGNPVSSLVCLHRYILPNPPQYARLTQDISFEPKLTYFQPVKISYSEYAMVSALPLAIKNSGEFIALGESDGFIELPATKSRFYEGECFPLYLW